METSNPPSVSVNNNDEAKHLTEEKMQIDNSTSPRSPPPRVPSPMITIEDESQEAAPSAAASTAPAAASSSTPSVLLTPTRDRKKSSPGPASAAQPRQRKRSQPLRPDLLRDPDKLLSYKHHDKKEEEDLEDPTVPGGQPKPPPEPRQAGQPAERKRSTVTFCPVIETIEKRS